MDTLIHWTNLFVKGAPSLLTSPFTYLLLIIIMLQWKRQVDLERKLFSAKLHTVAEGVFQSVFLGLIGGLICSLFIVGIGVVLPIEGFIYVWVIALVLLFFHVRFLCFAYAGAILGIFVLLANWFPQVDDVPYLGVVWQHLEGIYLPSLLAIISLLHLVEALLIYWSGGKQATPIYIHSKRGRLVGAYHIQHIWPVPLFIVTDGSTNQIAHLFSGWPIFSPDVVGPLTIALLPAVVHFSGQAISTTPRQKANFSAKWIVVYAIILFALSFTSIYLPFMVIIAIIFSFLGHEMMIWYSRWKEQKKVPVHIHPREGLKILALIPYTPAKRMGLAEGEVILRVNGQHVNRRKELYAALKQNLAFCKLEVLNLQGHIKFTNSSLYEHDHHQLGVVLAPDEDVPYYVEQRELNIVQLLKQRFNKKPSQIMTNELVKKDE